MADIAGIERYAGAAMKGPWVGLMRLGGGPNQDQSLHTRCFTQLTVLDRIQVDPGRPSRWLTPINVASWNQALRA
jgi:hypothetical protein